MNSSEAKKRNYFGSYEELVRAFIAKGYETIFFTSEIEPKRNLILRHDIDFDCRYASEVARVEHDLGVAATYFFLLSSDSYNLLSKRNKSAVLQIREMGHRISLHFDPVIYGDDFMKGFRYEREVFEKTFETGIETISIHRPNDFFLDFDEGLDDVEHTYQKKFFEDIKYISDSQGKFRFGHPLESAAFAAGDSIHLLTHPIWWQTDGDSNIGILQNHIENQKSFLHSHVGENCKPYKEYLDKQ